jgi:hypothetical protein
MTVPGFNPGTTSKPRVLTMTDGTESGVFGYGLAVTNWQLPVLSFRRALGLLFCAWDLCAFMFSSIAFCLVVYDICHADFL